VFGLDGDRQVRSPTAIPARAPLLHLPQNVNGKRKLKYSVMLEKETASNTGTSPQVTE
jgi:hypothetical protein